MSFQRFRCVGGIGMTGRAPGRSRSRCVRQTPLLAALVALATCSFAGFAWAESEHGIRVAVTKTIKGVYTLEAHVPDLTATEWIVFASQAPELPGQTNTRSRLLPGGDPYQELSERHRLLMRAQVPVYARSMQHTLQASVEWQATLRSRNLEVRQPGATYLPTSLSSSERQVALAESATLDFSAEPFQHWLRKHRLRKEPGETDLSFARRAFLAITRSMRYAYAEKMDRHASHVCQADRADCGGMCALYVATLRANGIPARMLLGRWAKSAVPRATLDGVAYHQQHVKAEFFPAGVGWTPVDLSSAVLHDKTPEGLRYFGRDAGDFLTVQVDPDLQVDSVHWGMKSLTLLQGIQYYVRGSGKFANATSDRGWQVETLR